MSLQRANSSSAPTLIHVARLAGVGLGTASRALSGQGYIKEETAARIMEAAEQLGYQKNELARSLKVKRSGAIGLVVPDIGGPFMAACVRTIQRKLRQNGYTLLIAFSDGSEAVEQEELDYLLRYQIDGLIVIPAKGSAPHFTAPQLARLPVVAFDQPIEGDHFDAVLVKNKQGARDAVNHLIGHGHKRIACLGVYGHLYSIKKRIEGYRSAMRQAGLPLMVEIVEPGEDRIGQQIESWLALPDPPTALFSLNELTTTATVEAFLQRGLRMPEDLAFIGFDDIQLGPYLQPPLTAVLQPAEDIGRGAAERLLEHLQGVGVTQPAHIMLAPTLIVRNSCGCRPEPLVEASASIDAAFRKREHLLPRKESRAVKA